MAQANTAHSGEGHGSVGSYVTGFILAVILTVIPFALVMTHAMSPGGILGVVAVLAFIQVIVHLVYFLHMNGSSAQRWNVMAFVFAVLVVGILIVGTVWIMENVSFNMMTR